MNGRTISATRIIVNKTFTTKPLIYQDISGKTCPIFNICKLEKGGLYAADCREHLQSNKKGMAIKGIASSTMDHVNRRCSYLFFSGFCIRDF